MIVSDAWIRQQLKDIEKLQRGIVVQQSKADESLARLKKESALILKKIDEVDAAVGDYISPELEKAVKETAVRVVSIDKKVLDIKKRHFGDTFPASQKHQTKEN